MCRPARAGREPPDRWTCLYPRAQPGIAGPRAAPGPSSLRWRVLEDAARSVWKIRPFRVMPYRLTWAHSSFTSSGGTELVRVT